MAPALRFAGGFLAAASVVAGSWNPFPDIVTRDVAIIGGGASGAYAAVRLKEDFGRSVVVIEKAARLGGHVSTYEDPVTGQSFDYGVQSFNDYGPARDFFARMGVPIGTNSRHPVVSQYADFTSGQRVNFTLPPNEERIAAMERFLNVTAPFEQYTLPGYWNFPAPDRIPDDLLLPFGEFVRKYDLHAAVNQVFQVTGMGTGDMANALTLYVLGAFGQPMLRSFLGLDAAFTPASGRNIELYEAIQERLGTDVRYNSVVVQSLRTVLGHTLWVKDSRGKSTVVIARKLLMAIEPTPANMAPFGLDKVEHSVFSKFRHTTVHAGLVTHPSLPINGSVINTPAASSPDNYLVLPKPNFNVRFEHLGRGSDLFRVMVVGDEKLDKAKAQDVVRASLSKLIEAGTLPPPPPGSSDQQLQFRAWADHGAMHMNVDARELRSGFIQKLYALQGRRQTWWTGGAFSVQFQSILWAFDDILLPKMLA